MKRPISATIDEKLLKWIDGELADRNRYRNKSHLIEVALEMLKRDAEAKEKGRR
jgi:Arc/MetJ-type ribon-helix-helix transcriptional regulator